MHRFNPWKCQSTWRQLCLGYPNICRTSVLWVGGTTDCNCTDAHSRWVAPHPMAGAELGVLGAVHLDHVGGRRLHAVVLVSQLIPSALQPLAMATPAQTHGPSGVSMRHGCVGVKGDYGAYYRQTDRQNRSYWTRPICACLISPPGNGNIHRSLI